jgi:hypothetical protein
MKKRIGIEKTHKRIKHTDSDGLSSFYWGKRKCPH